MAAALNPGVTPLWQVSVDTYHAMIDKGILTSDDPVELLEGVIVQKMSKNPPHRFANRSTRLALEHVVPAGWYVDEQAPVTLSNSEPEPDVLVIRGDSRDYTSRHPGPAEIGLIVEISDATLTRDRFLKKRIYAAAGIPVYWLLDLNGRRLEVYSEPEAGEYRRCTVYHGPDSVEVILDGQPVGAVGLSGLLP